MANTLKFGNGQWATGNGQVLAYNDENSNFKPLPFDFTRASSGTVVNQSGLIETVGIGIPRIDFQGNTKGALLLEPQRSNITYPSENFSSQLQGASSTFGTVVSPDGTLNGSTIASTADGAYKGWHETYSLTNDTYTFSMFVKYYNSQWISIYRIGQAISRFDVKNGVFGNNPSNLKSVDYGNGWYRLEFTFTAASGTNYLYIYPSTDSGETSSLGDGFYIWGGQLEQGSYATSYIPTSGSAVTRAAETCLDAGTSSTFNSTEGVLYAEISGLANDGTNRRITISDGAGNNDVGFRFNNVSNQIQVVSYVNSTVVVNQTYVLPDITVIKKYALKWALNNYALWVDGVEVITNNSAISFPQGTLNTLNFGSGTNTSNFYGNTKDIRVYNEALTDAQLQTLTTL